MGSAVARGLLVVFVALLVGGAAYVFSESQPKEYVAISRLAYGRLLSPELQVLGADFGEPQVDEDVRIATEAEQVNSFDVAEATARSAPELGFTANQIASRVTAEPVRGSLVVRVTATGETAEGAARLGTAYTRAYQKLLRDRERSRAMTVETALEQRLNALPRASRRGPLGAGVRNQLSIVNVLRRVGSGSPRVIEAARASSVAAKPQTRRNVLFGLVFGLLVGIGLVALRAESRSRAVGAAGSRMPAMTGRGRSNDDP